MPQPLRYLRAPRVMPKGGVESPKRFSATSVALQVILRILPGMTTLPTLPGNLEGLLRLIREDVIEARPQFGATLRDGGVFWLIAIIQEIEPTPDILAALAVTKVALERLSHALDHDPPNTAEIAWSKRVTRGSLIQLHIELADAQLSCRERCGGHR